MFFMWIYFVWKESIFVKKNFFKELFCFMIEEIYIDIDINLNDLNGNLCKFVLYLFFLGFFF